MTDSYTNEELNSLPQTTTTFDRPALQFDQHEWLQEGYMIRDVCNPSNSACEPVGIPIGNAKMLVKTNGRYGIIDEKR